jgi:hypothetical protein
MPSVLRLNPSFSLFCGLTVVALGVVSSCASSPIHTAPEQHTAEMNTPATVVFHQSHETTASVELDSIDTIKPADETNRVTPESEQTQSERQISMGPDPVAEQNLALSEEIRSLYRRLHIELPPDRRSSLIIELLNDPRTEHRMLGFELANRDLSASVTLDDAVGHAMHTLITDEDPRIRASAARLITRLVPPDAMLVLTKALLVEPEPIAAEPMLMGMARWPNGDAKPIVIAWLKRKDAPLHACFSAAWSFEQEGYWDTEVEHPEILQSLRLAQPRELRQDGMRLLARIGSSEDLRRLTDLMLSEDPGIVRWSASALVETPRAVEVLVQAAQNNEVFYQAAAESLINHRPTPDGLRRLSDIPQSDPSIRDQALLRLGQKISRDQLGESVRLAQLEAENSIAILARLATSEEPHTARSAKGVIQLAQLQLEAGRPNRVIEALLSIEEAPIDPSERPKLDRILTTSLLLLGRLDEATRVSESYFIWRQAIDLAPEDLLKSRIAAQLITILGENITDEQALELKQYIEHPNANEADTEVPDTVSPAAED